jgi:hypothetical protein
MFKCRHSQVGSRLHHPRDLSGMHAGKTFSPAYVSHSTMLRCRQGPEHPHTSSDICTFLTDIRVAARNSGTPRLRAILNLLGVALHAAVAYDHMHQHHFCGHVPLTTHISALLLLHGMSGVRVSHLYGLQYWTPQGSTLPPWPGSNWHRTGCWTLPLGTIPDHHQCDPNHLLTCQATWGPQLPAGSSATRSCPVTCVGQSLPRPSAHSCAILLDMPSRYGLCAHARTAVLSICYGLLQACNYEALRDIQ